jgi:hypothetical protein
LATTPSHLGRVAVDLPADPQDRAGLDHLVEQGPALGGDQVGGGAPQQVEQVEGHEHRSGPGVPALQEPEAGPVLRIEGHDLAVEGEVTRRQSGQGGHHPGEALGVGQLVA